MARKTYQEGNEDSVNYVERLKSMAPLRPLSTDIHLQLKFQAPSTSMSR